MRINNERQCIQAVIEYVKAGLSVVEIVKKLEDRGAYSYPVGVELMIERAKRQGLL
jgi:hypothetical protein